MIAAIVFIIFGIFAYWFYCYLYYNKYLKNVPGPKAYPIVGSGFEFTDTKSFLSKPLEFYRKYGGIVKAMLGFDMVILVSDYKMMEYFLASNKLIDKADQYSYLHRWLGTGLLTSTGEKWRKRRKIITPGYHFQILEQFVDIFDINSNILIKKLEKEVDKGSTDIYPYITLCALDNICETAMGTAVNAQTDSESEYVQSVKNICRIMVERVFTLLQRYDISYRFTNNYKQETANLKILHNYTLSVITQRRKQLQNADKQGAIKDEFGQKKRVAFLDLLLQSTIDGKPLTDEDIREEVDTFMFEGHDTTASGMSFTLFCIANNPHVQAKIVEEQRSIFGEDPHRMPTHRELQEMKYLELVIKETLRLYPSVPMFARGLSEDVKYSNDITFRKGTQVFLAVYNLHRNPEVFPDPEKFDPERFADGSISKLPYAYVPFSAGPRNCIGQKFAMLEMKSVVSKVIRNFELQSVVPEHQMELVQETILKSSNGVLMQVKKRNW